ncbi:MAG: hypothetical protein NTZ94_16845, partial [Verrucomicrobia bacterium]|nr:hypothetical protein [Verrucomicrobiota bacterium]
MPGSNPLKNLTFSLTLKDQEDQVDLRRPLEGIGAAQVRWDFYNRRDPRSLWKNEKYKDIQNAVQGFAEAARDLNAGFGDCKLNASNSLIKAYGEDGFKDETAVLDAFNKLYSIYQDCSVKSPASTIALNNSLIKYRSTLKALQEAAKKTWAFAFTYDFIRQSLPDASTATPAASPILKAAFASAAATTTIPTTLPSLSSYGLTWESGQYGRMKYTGSIHATFFNNAPTAAGNGMRDYRISNDFEVKLIDNKASKLDGLKFNLSGIYLDLRKEPLGQKVQLFGKSVTSPGKMGVVVGKLTIPGPNSGVKIPLSMSYATRTELLPDKEWRAGLGVTFNWRD